MSKVNLRFEDVFVSDRKIKTKKYQIFNIAWDNYLGEIKWYAPWRKYCFYPGDSTVFDSKCLQDIQDKIDELMAERLKANEN